jgi:hypothetical protein
VPEHWFLNGILQNPLVKELPSMEGRWRITLIRILRRLGGQIAQNDPGALHVGTVRPLIRNLLPALFSPGADFRLFEGFLVFVRGKIVQGFGCVSSGWFPH